MNSMTKALVQVVNPSGLHARPASMFVAETKKYKSAIQITKEGKTINAKSIIALLSLGVKAGTEIEIMAEGEDEAQAVAALEALVKSGFGEL